MHFASFFFFFFLLVFLVSSPPVLLHIGVWDKNGGRGEEKPRKGLFSVRRTQIEEETGFSFIENIFFAVGKERQKMPLKPICILLKVFFCQSESCPRNKRGTTTPKEELGRMQTALEHVFA